MNTLNEFVPWLRVAPTGEGLLLPSKAEMVRFDKLTTSSGTSSLELMERAGEGVADAILTWEKSEDALSGQILVLCGPGNNGGDGFVVARILASQGYFVQALLVNSARYSTDMLKVAQKFIDNGGVVRVYGEDGVAADFLEVSAIGPGRLFEALERCSGIIDCLLGTGQESAPRGYIAEVLQMVTEARRAEAKLISVDIPTGVNGDNGAVYPGHFQCDLCVTIQLVKRGLTQYPARASFRRLAAVDIGISCDQQSEYSFIDPANHRSILQRAPESHKGSQGRVLVIAGSQEMPGAGVLASRACLTAGAGLVVMSRLRGVEYPNLPPELMYHFTEESNMGSFGMSDYEGLVEKIAWADAILIGPGIGRSDSALDLTSSVIEQARICEVPCIVDADALRVLRVGGLDRDGFERLILTPHPGEMAFLLDCDIADVQADRFSAVKALFDDTGSVCVLKGAGSLVYHAGEGRANTTGNPYMASGGCGDALAGIIAAFAAKSPHDLFGAACLGVFCHGLAGDIAHDERSFAVLASDLIASLPVALTQVWEAID